MLVVQAPTANTLQKQILILEDGTQITITIEFKPMQFGWFIRELIYEDFTLNGFRIFTSPNILYQFKNLIPFGLMCTTKDGQEPKLQQDFSSGYASLFVLTSSEVDQLAALYSE